MQVNTNHPLYGNLWYIFRDIHSLKHKLLFKNYKHAILGPQFLNNWDHNSQNKSQHSFSGFEPCGEKIYCQETECLFERRRRQYDCIIRRKKTFRGRIKITRC